MIKLSPAQRKTLEGLEEFRQKNHTMPTVIELSDHLGISKAAAWGRMLTLQERGYITSKSGIARSTQITERGVSCLQK